MFFRFAAKMDMFKGLQKSVTYVTHRNALSPSGIDPEVEKLTSHAVQLAGWPDHALCLAHLPVHQGAVGPG